MAFWRADGGELPDCGVEPEELTVVRPHGKGVRRRSVTAVLLPVARAVPVLSRARAMGRSGDATGSAAFWGAGALVALQLTARGRLLPGLSPSGFDAWRLGPLDGDDVRRIRELAAAMPPEARAVPLPDSSPVTLPAAEPLLRSFLDAVADGLPRSPTARQPAGGPAFAAPTPVRVPEQREWAAEVAAGMDAGVRVSLRLEHDSDIWDGDWDGEDLDDSAEAGPRFRAVVQIHSLADPALMVDAAELWAAEVAAPAQFGTRARSDALLALRRGAKAWPPLSRLLSAPVPDVLRLADDELLGLLGQATERLAAVGIEAHLPKGLVKELTASGLLVPPRREKTPSDLETFLSSGQLIAFRWQLALGGEPLTEEETDRLIEAHRPVVRLRDQWVVVDQALIRKVRERRGRELTAIDALGAALTGEVAIDGESVPVTAGGVLERLRARIAEPEPDADATSATPGQPAMLAATLRDYQLRGLAWLDRMTSLGLGCCLADDMGLGKTITVIALHLRRHQRSAHGPTLVVCPTSLLGNWEREVRRFAPGTAVRRFHGPGRNLDDLAPDAFVLTTYGTLRRDAQRLAEPGVPWDLLVADEAQHVKNPYSDTARALRSVPAAGRVALTGTPVENNLSELWALLDWTTPGLLGTLTAFWDRYARAVEADGDQATAHRLTRLIRPFLLRRRKSDPGIAPELPPKTETDQPVALTREQASLYEALVRESLAAIGEADGMARRGLVMKLLTGLKQVCNHPAQYLKEKNAKLAGRSGKLELLDELLDTIVAEDGSALVFTQYVEMGRLLEQHLAARGTAAQFLHGGTPVKQREEMVDRFQRGERPVFLLSLKAAGTGLNLTRAGHVIHFDRWWNPAVEDQATDRAYRIGQTQPVQVHRLIAEGTVEDRIAEMLQRKKDLADAVLSHGEAALTELSDAELADLVTMRQDIGSGRTPRRSTGRRT
ncbi:SNF2/RAD54 family helicase (plasmid) [Streptantibioticus cattleyicolor NRRL 8057 = DSM 46488]|uniref:SNF2/RAD54 family helicase n=1 Tax=Streptantibioticus cattleyicolor (strain ATCC 35852 / DSM 46488 / JCM 4925 / NBRC 14057 / NRRL 8057) TaxID=1003195 RepID=G8XHF9_STREN|nr:SNF2/RAD54 family helicase [Streptantibioticus cattleyicolor NRRL 8057 = DSM 46488]